MQATPIKIDVSTNFKCVTLMVEDFTPFLKLGVPVELTVVQGEMPTMPENVTSVVPDNVTTLPPITAEGSKEETVTNVPGTPPPVEACELCKGTGQVALFPDGATEGVPTRCDPCRGTGMKYPPPLPTQS